MIDRAEGLRDEKHICETSQSARDKLRTIVGKNDVEETYSAKDREQSLCHVLSRGVF